MDQKKQMVEIWGDIVEIRSLIISIIISVTATMGFFSIAPNGDRTKGLFFGLIGSVIGFIVSTIIIKPKRVITIENEDK